MVEGARLHLRLATGLVLQPSVRERAVEALCQGHRKPQRPGDGQLALIPFKEPPECTTSSSEGEAQAVMYPWDAEDARVPVIDLGTGSPWKGASLKEKLSPEHKGTKGEGYLKLGHH